jgi:hypothetical protein
LNEYENILKVAIEAGYTFVTLQEFCKRIKDGSIRRNEKIFINRHDIDSDVATARRFFEIEKRTGVKATYYFRLSTLSFELMEQISRYGSEASYHFEEIATYAKRNGIKSQKALRFSMQEISEEFEKNFHFISNRLSFPMKTVCSHGDFVNRKLGIVNYEILKSDSLRKRLGIECEAYDEEIMKHVDVYVSDKQYPHFWHPADVREFIGKKKIIYMLTHPRQWYARRFCNTKENMVRVYDGIKYFWF